MVERGKDPGKKKTQGICSHPKKAGKYSGSSEGQGKREYGGRGKLELRRRQGPPPPQTGKEELVAAGF
jgi:hypothetical protein